MQKIPTVFIRKMGKAGHTAHRNKHHVGVNLPPLQRVTLINPRVAKGCEWVLRGEGTPTVKWDGSACMVKNGTFYKRYDCKVRKERHLTYDANGKKHFWRPKPPYAPSHFKIPPVGFIEAQPQDPMNAHWPGWIPVGGTEEDKWHREALGWFQHVKREIPPHDGTYELVGPKIQANPYQLDRHKLWEHGGVVLNDYRVYHTTTFKDIESYFEQCSLDPGMHPLEGIVWHHPDGRMAKVKVSDFGFEWPPVLTAKPAP